jgi:hypothetical protein
MTEGTAEGTDEVIATLSSNDLFGTMVVTSSVLPSFDKMRRSIAETYA